MSKTARKTYKYAELREWAKLQALNDWKELRLELFGEDEDYVFENDDRFLFESEFANDCEYFEDGHFSL